jgi:hypothetical protein
VLCLIIGQVIEETVLCEYLDRKWSGKDNVFKSSAWGGIVRSHHLAGCPPPAHHSTWITKKGGYSASSVHLHGNILIPDQIEATCFIESHFHFYKKSFLSSWFYSLLIRVKEVLAKRVKKLKILVIWEFK